MDYKLIGMWVWNKTPDYVKWPIVIGLLFIWTPLKVREMMVDLIRYEVHAMVDPMKRNRDTEILGMNTRISTIDTHVMAIGIHLMGAPKLERMSEEIKAMSAPQTIANDGKK